MLRALRLQVGVMAVIWLIGSRDTRTAFVPSSPMMVCLISQPCSIRQILLGGDNAGVQRHGMGKSASFDRPGASHIRQELQNPNVNYSRWQRLSRRSESGFCDVSSASGEACPVKTAVLRKRKPLGA